MGRKTVVGQEDISKFNFPLIERNSHQLVTIFIILLNFFN